MDKTLILERLELLVALIEKTESDIPNEKNLFSRHSITTMEMLEVQDTIEDYIAQGAKINAIKYYRQEMSDKFGEQVTLREAKEYIDKVADDMRLRGIIKR